MHICSFCGCEARPFLGKLCLCAECRRQLTELRPDSRRYMWYVSAMRRALFG